MYFIIEKIEHIKYKQLQEQRKNEIKLFIETKPKNILNKETDELLVDTTLVIAVQKHLNDEIVKKTKKR